MFRATVQGLGIADLGLRGSILGFRGPILRFRDAGRGFIRVLVLKPSDEPTTYDAHSQI